MEFTQEFIDSLSANEDAVTKHVADELNIRPQQVQAVVSLINEGCTVPFISRYRKEKHGSLDEVQVRDCDHLFKSRMNLENRRIEIIRGIFAQGKLTDFVYEAVTAAKTLTELEDLWAPFKKKKKTRGMLAAERGLEPLAEAMTQLDEAAIEKKAEEFVNTDAENEELRVPDVQAALAGAQDIIAERTAQDGSNRAAVLDFYVKSGTIRVKGIGDDEAKKTSVYQMYWDYSEPLNQIKPHRILAVNRGEREGVLEVTVDVDIDGASDLLKRRTTIHNTYHAQAIEDGLARLLSPAVVREIRGNQSDEADDHGIGIFSENLKNLLMTQPIKGTRVLGVDPGIRTGTKCAALDETGDAQKQKGFLDAEIFCTDESLIAYYQKIARTLRSSNVSAEVFPEAKKMNQQYAAAEKKCVPFGIFADTEQAQKNLLTLKNLATREQYENLTVHEAAAKIKAHCGT